jgi:hypothetical protein
MFGERISVVRLSPASESVGKKSRKEQNVMDEGSVLSWFRAVFS